MTKTSADRILPLRAPVPPIVMGARGPSARSRTAMALRVLLRFIAVVWLTEGVLQWLGVLMQPDTTYLPAVSPLHLAGMFFFCSLDLVAAVGLWLVTRWGVAVWLVTILGHLLALWFAPGFMAKPTVLGLSDAGLLAAYAGLAWTVARERRRA